MGKALQLLSGASTEAEMYDICLETYSNKYYNEAEEAFGNYAAEHGIDRDHALQEHEEAREVCTAEYIRLQLLEQAYLLWMVRELDDKGEPVMWVPPRRQ